MFLGLMLIMTLVWMFTEHAFTGNTTGISLIPLLFGVIAMAIEQSRDIYKILKQDIEDEE